MNLPEFTDDERKYYREVWGFDPITDLTDLPGGGKGYQATFALDFPGVSIRVEVYHPDYQPHARTILERGEKRTHNFLEEINDEEYLQLLGDPKLEFYSKYFPKFQELDKFLEKFPYDRVPEKKAAFLFAACSYIAKIIVDCGLRKFLFETIGSHIEDYTQLHSGLCVVLDELHIPEFTRMQHEFILKLIEQASEDWLITNWEPVSIDFHFPYFLFSSDEGGLYPLLPTPLQEKILRVAAKVAPQSFFPEMAQPGVKITPVTDGWLKCDKGM